MSFNGGLSPRENSISCRESPPMGLGRTEEAPCSRSPCAAGRRVGRRVRRRLWSRWRIASLPVLLLVVLSLGRVTVSSATETAACLYETTLDELGAGSHVVSVEVSHTFDGVPAADENCPQ
ncbi:unnamed protein product, partial [Laminaria digitata]